MAWVTPKSSKTTVFPKSLKTFVRDVTSLKRTSSGHSRARSVASVATESERAWSVVSDFDCPEEQPEHKAGISVQLFLTFEDPLEFSCNRCYNSSAEFKPSERLLRGLIRRIDHGSFELITRKDPNATSAIRTDGRPKLPRFEMTFQISQKGSLWATRTYKSYQKDAMNAKSVKEVVLSSHRLIGLFLRRHDPEFVWRDGPIRDELPEDPELSPYRVGGVQTMSCIPRSRFLEKTQTFEAIPGFKISLSITSRSQRREPPEWHKTIELESNQTTPLNLAVAEALFSNASYALEAATRLKRKTIEERHRHSCGFISGICQHYEEEATDISLCVTNNLGPKFDHLERTIKSKIVLFGDIESKESIEFFNNVESALGDALETADHTINGTNDFEFRVVELRGRGWNIDEPLVFTLGPSDSYSRRSIQAILDRVQAGVADVLRGNAATVRMSAAKRGHYILDKTLLAPRDPSTDASRWSIPSKNKAKVVDKLRRRIHQDIDMICKDTCSLDNLDESEPAAFGDLPSKVDVFGQSEFEAVQIPLPQTPSPSPAVMLDKVVGDRPSTPLSTHNRRPQTSANATTDELTNESKPPSRPRPKSFSYLKSGARIFPLVPTASSYGFSEILPPVAKQELDQPRSQSSNAVSESRTAGQDQGSISQRETESQDFAQQSSMKREASSSDLRAAQAQNFQVPSERRSSTSTLSNHKRSADELSVAPSTPSLVFGGGHSARSSLYLTTPQVQGASSNGDVDTLMSPGTPDSNNDVQLLGDATEVDSGHKISQSPTVDPASSRTPTLAKHKPIPSPLQQQDHAGGENDPVTADILEKDNPGSSPDVDSNKDNAKEMMMPNVPEADAIQDKVTEAAESLGNSQLFAGEDEAIKLEMAKESDEATSELVSARLPPFNEADVLDEVLGIGIKPKSPRSTPGQVIAIPVEVVSTDDVKTPIEPVFRNIPTPSTGFAQTRQDFDFDFSSPWSTASPYSEGSPPAFYAHLDNAIDDGPEDSRDSTNKLLIPRPPSSSLVRPLFSRIRRRSFGSAGLLGFRVGEPRLIEVGLRRAMMIPMIRGMGASPTTAMSFLNDMSQRMRRSAASEGQVELARRPHSSHGTGATLPHSDGNQGVMKRSASSGLLQDMVVLEAKAPDKTKDKKKDKGAQDRERRQGRSGSLMFLIAGATLASQMMGASK